MIRVKVLGRTYSKRLSKPDLKATFSDVCLVKTELKSNDLRIQVFVLEKPYIVYMCIVEIHEMNITSIKIKQRQNPSKRKPTTLNPGQNLLRQIAKIPIFALAVTKMLSVANEKTVSPLPYCNVFYGVHLSCYN